MPPIIPRQSTCSIGLMPSPASRLSFSGIPHREIAPPGHLVWVQKKDDEYSKLEQFYADWIRDVAATEELFAKHIRGNSDLNDADLRQHRFALCHLMAAGERLAFNFLCLDGKKDVKSYVNLIDEKVTALRKEFIDWHTPEGYQDSVPDSFKDGMKEAAEGKLLEFPDAET